MAYGGTQVRFTGAPLAPSQVTSIAADASATVSWVSPGSGPVAASYTVTPWIAGAAQATTTVAAPATSATVTGLANSTAYTFSVHATGTAGSSAESAQSGQNTPLLNLLFGDDFNGSFLDPAWSVLTRDGDQSAPEGQYYVASNVTLDGAGNLVIHAQAGSVTLPGYNDANPPSYAGSNVTRSYTSGAVQATGFSFTFGKAQASMKVPSGANLWPAFWLLGSGCQVTNPHDPNNVSTCNWPNSGSNEIDIAEFNGNAPAAYNCAMFSGGASFGPNSNAVSSGSTTFHTYGLDWASGTLSWKLDGAQVQSTAASVPSTPLFPILQTAVRGGTPTFTQPDLTVDWVRIFHN